MISSWIRKVTKTKEFLDGARILPEHVQNLPFKNDANKLAHMFELRNWYVRNSPHSLYS